MFTAIFKQKRLAGRFLSGRREFDRHEPVGPIEIVFFLFIDHTDSLGGIGAGRGLITRYALPRSSDAAFPSFRTQIARYGYFRAELTEAFFDLPVTFADAVCFEPVYFCFINVTIYIPE